MGFNVSVRQVDAVTLVTITGSVMWAEAEALHEMFRDLTGEGPEEDSAESVQREASG